MELSYVHDESGRDGIHQATEKCLQGCGCVSLESAVERIYAACAHRHPSGVARKEKWVALMTGMFQGWTRDS